MEQINSVGLLALSSTCSNLHSDKNLGLVTLYSARIFFFIQNNFYEFPTL